MTWEIVADVILTIALLLLLGIELLLVKKAWAWVKKKLGFKTQIFHVEELPKKQTTKKQEQTKHD